MYEAILTIKYGIYESKNKTLGAKQEIFGKAIKMIKGNTLENCEYNVKEFLKESDFLILLE